MTSAETLLACARHVAPSASLSRTETVPTSSTDQPGLQQYSGTDAPAPRTPLPPRTSDSRAKSHLLALIYWYPVTSGIY